MLEGRELLAWGESLEDKIASTTESRSKGAEEIEEDGSYHVMIAASRKVKAMPQRS